MIDWNKAIDPNTKLLGYKAWGKSLGYDPEVDSAYHTMHYYYLAKLYNQKEDYIGRDLQDGFEKSVKHYIHSKGIFRRFSSEGQWAIDSEGNPNQKYNFYNENAYFNNPDNLSRDNMMPTIIALGEYGNVDEVKAAIWELIKRFSFFQNHYTTRGEEKPTIFGIKTADVATPDHWSIFLRSYIRSREVKNDKINLFQKIIFYIFLTLFDVFNIASDLILVIQSYYDPTHTASEYGHVCRAIQRKLVMPTLTGNVSIWLYSKFIQGPMEQFPDTCAILSRFMDFFDNGKTHRVKEVVEFVRPAVKKYLNN